MDSAAPDGGCASGRLRILLLEDSDIDAELLQGHLDKAELAHDIARVRDRDGFLAGLEARPQVILADYALPDFDGLAALDLAKERAPETPFIFVSGVVGEEFATNALKRGAVDYVMKRNLTRLAAAVARAVAERRERAERREAEAALQATEISIRMAVSAAQLGSWRFQPPLGRLTADARCAALFGLEEGAPPEAFLDHCHPGDRARMVAAVEAAIRPGGRGEIDEECRTVGADGRMRWIAIRGQAVFRNGACTDMLGVVRDITEQKRAEEEMRRINRMLEERVVERTRERDRIWLLSPDLLAVAGLDGYLKTVNPAWTDLLGHDRDRLLRRPFFALMHADDRARGEEMMAAARAGRAIERFDCRIRRADGHYRRISWTAVPEAGAIYAIGRDVTEERANSEEIASANRRLLAEIAERERVEETLRQMQRLEAVGQLTSGVAHDFNNLLTVVLGNVTLVERTLRESRADPRTLTRLSHMRTAAERGAKLTEQLLAFSRRQRLEPKPVDLNETVAGMRELLHSTMGGSIRIETGLQDDLWRALVDPTQIELIILNLAINARDAMEVGGGLTVKTANVTLDAPPRRPEEPGPGDYVTLTVSDSGTGMTDEVLARAVEPFFTTKEVGKGSGLGLAQVYGFAKQSGGGIRIDTRLGEGTSVSVYLPRAREAAAADRGPAAEPPDAAGTGGRILLVDDDSAVREVAAATLMEMGYSVVEAGSGGAALEALEDGQAVDLLLIDYAMPGMNGGEVARAARARHPSLSVLFITGYADLQALGGIGEDRIVQKPFSSGELSRKVQQAIGRPWARLDEGRKKSG
jgi:PAS domain S-box-containing protein